MANTLKASQPGLVVIENARKQKGWNKCDQEWAKAANVSVPTLRRFWKPQGISRDLFISICRAADVEWIRVTDTGSANLESLIHKGADAWNEWKVDNPPHGYTLDRLDLRELDLRGADFSNTSLVGANFSGCKLNGASFAGADLTKANFNGADLSGVDLSATQAIATTFTEAVLTGACIENWNINFDTCLENINCAYVYLQKSQCERRPRSGIFKSGEFTALFQQALDTVDLIFKDGVDWQAFFHSFQELKKQYPGEELSIQAIEKKANGAFVVRLEVSESTNLKALRDRAKGLYSAHQSYHPDNLKEEIEKRAKELYQSNLEQVEKNYRDMLQSKENELIFHRNQSAKLIEQSASLTNVVKVLGTRFSAAESLTSSDVGSKYDFRGASIGNIFELEQSTVHQDTVNRTINQNTGSTIGSVDEFTVNNYNNTGKEIGYLLSAIRSQTDVFPDEHKADSLFMIEDLERDLSTPEPNQDKIKRRLMGLIKIAVAVAGEVLGNSPASSFTDVVLRLANNLGISLEDSSSPKLIQLEEASSQQNSSDEFN